MSENILWSPKGTAPEITVTVSGPCASGKTKLINNIIASLDGRPLYWGDMVTMLEKSRTSIVFVEEQT